MFLHCPPCAGNLFLRINNWFSHAHLEQASYTPGFPIFKVNASGACGGEAPLKIQMPLRHSSSRRPLMLTERTDRQSKDADHAVQAKIPVSFTQKYHPNWS